MSFALLYNLLPENILQKWWDAQWNEARVFWDFGNGRKQLVNDCLIFEEDDFSLIDDLLVRIGDLPEDLDERVRWVMARILRLYPQPSSYRFDSEKHKKPDYWQSPFETLRDGTGDCDDWGILLYATLRRAGVPSWRLKCVVTDVVQNGNPAGAHFNLIYLSKKDYEWYTLEGTWYPSVALSRYGKLPRKSSTDLYARIWFTFNEEKVWAQHDFKVKPVFINPEVE
jgi:hypothetical protein